MGGCQNWSRRSGPQNLDQIWTKSGHHLDRFLKNGCQNSRQDTLPKYEGMNFGFRFVSKIRISSVPWLRTWRNLGPFLNSGTKKSICMHVYIRAKEWAHWAFLKLFHVHLHTQENALWTSPEWSGPVQNLDSMSGHAVEIFWSGQPCTSVWTGSGPDLDQIWNRAKTVWTNFGNHPMNSFILHCKIYEFICKIYEFTY